MFKRKSDASKEENMERPRKKCCFTLALAERQRSNPEEIKILINDVLLAVKLNTSMLSVQDIHNHMAQYVKMPESWRSENYAFEILESISTVIQLQVMAEIRNAFFHTLIVDESTDISVNNMLILYFKYRSAATSSVHKTVFGGIVKLTSCNAEAITSSITDFYTENQLDLMKMVMLTSDGASVMLGRNNGVATRLKELIPHLLEQHCVAHHEDLGIDDAWTKVPLIKDIESLLRTVYSVFNRSPARKSQFEELALINECDSVAFRPLNEVRWLSRQFAVSALMRNYSVLIKYFEQVKTKYNDPIAKYCWKKLSNPSYHISLAVLNDVLCEFTDLCKVFQRSSLTTIEAVDFARAKIRKIRSQYLGETVFWSSTVQSLMSEYSEAKEDLHTVPILTFISLLCEHMDKRFPENELKEWKCFDLSALTSDDAKFDFGMENLKKLVEKYQKLLVFGDGEVPASSSTQQGSIVGQYSDFKCLVAEKVRGESLKTFQDLVNLALKNAADYNLVSQLVDICATFQASSADCERGFSLMNSIKSKSKNMLEENHLEMLMRTKAYLTSGEVNLDQVYVQWMNDKDRREKKCMQVTPGRSMDSNR